jgi:hypothetical protein
LKIRITIYYLGGPLDLHKTKSHMQYPPQKIKSGKGVYTLTYRLHRTNDKVIAVYVYSASEAMAEMPYNL